MTWLTDLNASILHYTSPEVTGIAKDSYIFATLMFIILTSATQMSPVCIATALFLVFMSEEQWQNDYFNKYDLGNPATQTWFFRVVAPCLVFGTYWFNGCFLLLCDYMFPQQLDKFRVQEKGRDIQGGRFSASSLKKMFKNLSINTLVGIGICWVCAEIHGRGIAPVKFTAEMDGKMTVCLQILLTILINEIMFFYGHWAMHANKWLYKNIHKIHHEFQSPCAFTAIYCHPLELLIADFIPLGFGLFFFNTHIHTTAVWIVFAVLGTQTHHCGFRWPWAGTDHQPDFHDLHHEKFNGNYGNMGFLDWIHGTGFPEEMSASSRKKAKMLKESKNPEETPEKISRENSPANKKTD